MQSLFNVANYILRKLWRSNFVVSVFSSTMIAAEMFTHTTANKTAIVVSILNVKCSFLDLITNRSSGVRY